MSSITLKGPHPPSLTVTNEEVWCKIPTKFAKFFNKWKLRTTTSSPKCYVTKVKILKHKLLGNHTSKKAKLQTYSGPKSKKNAYLTGSIFYLIFDLFLCSFRTRRSRG